MNRAPRKTRYPDDDHYDVRAYLHASREGRRPEGRIRLHSDDCRRLKVASVLVAGYRDEQPGSEIAVALVKRLSGVLRGPVGVVIYHRDTSRFLAAWIATELAAVTSVKAATTNYVPDRGARR